MKRALIAATVGAIGALGTAGLMSAAPASAQPCTESTPPFTPQRVACVAAENGQIFADSINPVNQLNILVYGTEEAGPPDAMGNPTTVRSGLGLVDQPTTFVNSVADFLNGPRSPDPGPTPAGPDTPAP
jgi:hypothetical protein